MYTIGLAETRLIGTAEITMHKGHTLYYSGQEKHHEGVAFIVRKEITILYTTMRLYIDISSRIILIRLKACLWT